MTCCFWRKTSVSVLAAAMAAITPLELCAATTYTVATGETFELASGGSENAADNRLDVSGSATLKLTGTATGGAFPLKLDIRFTSAAANAVLTVDASEVADCTVLRMTGDIRDNSGSATIALPSGMSEFVIGSNTKGNASALSFPVLEPDVSFAGSGRVVFTNDAAVVKLPTCTWAVADGGRLATLGPRVFGDGDFTVSDYDVELCDPGTFAQDRTVTVSTGRTLYIRPCEFDNAYNGTWIGSSTVGIGGYITNNIALGGAGAQVYYQNNNNIYGTSGEITGAGDVYFRGRGNVYMRGGFDWKGSLSVALLGVPDNAVYFLHMTNNATITPGIVVDNPYGGDFRIYPDGYEAGAVSARATSIAGNAETRLALLRVHANLALTVGEVSGSVRVMSIGSGAGAKLVVESLAANSTLYLRPGVALSVNSAGAGAKIVLESAGGESEEWSVSGPASGDAISPAWEFPENAAASALALGGRLAFPLTTPLPFGTVKILAGAEISANIADGTKIVNEGGTLTQLVSTWQDKVTLWTDASAGDTFTLARDDFPEKEATINSYVRVSEWRDRRADHQGAGALRFRQTAFDGSSAIMNTSNAGGFPQTNTTDGLRAVYCPPSKGRFCVSTGKNSSTDITVKYALFVFNSETRGGGNAFFCTSGAVLKRVDNADSVVSEGQKPLIYADAANAFSFRTNGVDVVSPTETYTTGGWQIISFANENGVTINNIGHASIPSYGSGNGGQIYAEILLFGEMPTEEERDAAETYLAKKWNLPLGHADVVQKPSVDLALSGSGTVSLAGDAAATNGWFRGTVNLNGHRLELSSEHLPYTEETLPSENRVLWVDPSAAGAIDYSEDENKPDEVAYLYSRDSSGVVKGDSGYYLTSPYVAGGADRRVRVVTGSRAEGPELPWLVFAQKYSGDTDGNHLIIRSLPASPMAAPSDAAAEIDVKAGFFALDTTAGGGTVIATRANTTECDFAARSDMEGAIFNGKCSDKVRAADAWLDETAIVPSARAYGFKPEVFAFNMKQDASAAKAKVIGFYGYGNNEIIGEFVLYSTTQTASVREGISAYLMKKWLGKMHAGYSDFRGMTVSGDGVLAAVGPEYLPELTSAFTGSLEFSRAEWSFTLPTDGSGSAVDAVDLGSRHVALPAAVVVNLDVTGSKSGTYVLMSAGSFAEGTSFSLGAVAGQRGRKVELAAGENSVSVKITAPGMIFLVR